MREKFSLNAFISSNCPKKHIKPNQVNSTQAENTSSQLIEHFYFKSVLKDLEHKLERITKHPEKYDVSFKVDNEYINFGCLIQICAQNAYVKAAKVLLMNSPQVKKEYEQQKHWLKNKEEYSGLQPKLKQTRTCIELNAKNEKLKEELLLVYDMQFKYVTTLDEINEC